MDFPYLLAIQVGPSHNYESPGVWYGTLLSGIPLEKGAMHGPAAGSPLYFCVHVSMFLFPFLRKSSSEYNSQGSPKGRNVLWAVTDRGLSES